jgi:mevalonate kinase
VALTPPSSLTARAPAKLILSGEHAVVYGHPALAMAINRYTESTIHATTPPHITVALPDLNETQHITLTDLMQRQHTLTQRYQRFLDGHLAIGDVLQAPSELVHYAVSQVLEKLPHPLCTGLTLSTQSNIPIGCGMGSSAATVLSALFAVSHFLSLNMHKEDYLTLGISAENLQHGRSSGLDLHISYQGGCLRYQQGRFEQRPMPTFPMQWVNTGTPNSTTGECVLHAKPYFHRTSLGDEFAATTHALDQAIQDNALADIKTHIRNNHRLLKRIGVVPKTVCEFIHTIEQNGGAAKICGAGTVTGEQAGVILVVMDDDIRALTEPYPYTHLPIQGDTHGTCLV